MSQIRITKKTRLDLKRGIKLKNLGPGLVSLEVVENGKLMSNIINKNIIYSIIDDISLTVDSDNAIIDVIDSFASLNIDGSVTSAKKKSMESKNVDK